MTRPRNSASLESMIANCEWDGDCLIWQGDRTNAGYPLASIKSGRRISARVVMLELSGKKRPAGVVAISTCGCKACLNLDHLKWGTRKEALQAAAERGAFNRPDHVIRNRLRHFRTLSDDAIAEIRASGKDPATVASEYGISKNYAQKLISYRARVPADPFAGMFLRLVA